MITKIQLCIQMRSGTELWLDEDRIRRIQSLLENIESSKFLNIDGQTINTADIVGIFDAKTMAELVRRKNGEHLCKHGVWHKRGDVCDCRPIPEDQTPERLNLSNDQEKNIEKIKEMTRILIEDNKSKSIKINPAYQKGSNKS